MAISRNEVQVDWGAGPSDSVSVSAGGSETSNVATRSANSFQSQIHIKADNDGTPASGDTVDFWVLQSLGDPDGAGSNEFETDEQGTFIGTLDTNADDPAESVFELPEPVVECKVLAKNNSGGRSITVSATILEQTG